MGIAMSDDDTEHRARVLEGFRKRSANLEWREANRKLAKDPTVQAKKGPTFRATAAIRNQTYSAAIEAARAIVGIRPTAVIVQDASGVFRVTYLKAAIANGWNRIGTARGISSLAK